MDNAKNFAKATVSTGYNSTDTSIVLTTGHGAKMPTVPFTLVWWNSTDYPDPSDDPNVEIVRCTARATDTLTVTRAQEGTSASTKNTASKTYKMIAGLTAGPINSELAPRVFWQANGDRNQTQGFNLNDTRCSGVYLPFVITVSKFHLSIATSDATGLYSIGLFDSTGARVAHCNPATLTGDASSPSGKDWTQAFVEGTITLYPGKYYMVITTNSATGLIESSSGNAGVTFCSETYLGVATSGGAQPASITPPADHWVIGQIYYMALQQ